MGISEYGSENEGMKISQDFKKNIIKIEYYGRYEVALLWKIGAENTLEDKRTKAMVRLGTSGGKVVEV